MSLIEVVGVLAGLGYVVFAIRESAWCWPSGIVSAIAYVVVFHEARLSGQAGAAGDPGGRVRLRLVGLEPRRLG